MSMRILIADDYGVIRGGLRALLNTQPDMSVVGEAVDGTDVLRLAVELRPDIILLDISMPGLDGIKATHHLKNMLPETQVLILTIHEDENLLREAIRAGAAGYIIKRAAEAELIEAIHVISHGDIYIHPSLTRSLVKNLSPLPTVDKPVETLTRREVEVLRMLARGYTNRQIAQEMNLSSRTVEGHRANLMSKLGLHSRVELVNYAEEHGLLE